MVGKSEDSAQVKMEIKTFLAELYRTAASDLLLAAGNQPSLRINGSLSPVGKEPLSAEEVEALIVPLVRKEELEQLKKEKELDTAYEDELSRYRVNLHYQRGSLAAAIRRIPKEIPPFNQLGLPQVVKDFTKLERGLVLVTGPTGSGKSTTQASLIDAINASRPVHIITIEDPIEFVHSPKKAVIEQREVGLDTRSFGEALKRALRQIPDVILVGEMRDLESVQMAITAAETGHLVISTLHTQDSAQSIDRIIDVFPPHQQPQIRTMLSLTLQGIISQQLVPKKNGQGMALAHEILVVTPAVRNIIRKGSTQEIYSMIELGTQYGMKSMDHSLRDLVKAGEISKEEALIAAISRDRLEKLID